MKSDKSSPPAWQVWITVARDRLYVGGYVLLSGNTKCGMIGAEAATEVTTKSATIIKQRPVESHYKLPRRYPSVSKHSNF